MIEPCDNCGQTPEDSDGWGDGTFSFYEESRYVAPQRTLVEGTVDCPNCGEPQYIRAAVIDYERD